MIDDPLRELAAAATQRTPQPLPYQTPAAAPAAAPTSPKGLFRVGFFFGLGFFTAGLVFWIIVFVGSIVLGGLLASACSVTGRTPAPAPAPWNIPR